MNKLTLTSIFLSITFHFFVGLTVNFFIIDRVYIKPILARNQKVKVTVIKTAAQDNKTNIKRKKNTHAEESVIKKELIYIKAEGLGPIRPKYPYKARLNDEEGRVGVAFFVGIDGSTSNLEVVLSSGYKLLDLSAVNAVKLAKFRSSTKDGTKVEDKVTLYFNFSLMKN